MSISSRAVGWAADAPLTVSPIIRIANTATIRGLKKSSRRATVSPIYGSNGCARLIFHRRPSWWVTIDSHAISLDTKTLYDLTNSQSTP